MSQQDNTPKKAGILRPKRKPRPSSPGAGIVRPSGAANHAPEPEERPNTHRSAPLTAEEEKMIEALMKANNESGLGDISKPPQEWIPSNNSTPSRQKSSNRLFGRSSGGWRKQTSRSQEIVRPSISPEPTRVDSQSPPDFEDYSADEAIEFAFDPGALSSRDVGSLDEFSDDNQSLEDRSDWLDTGRADERHKFSNELLDKTRDSQDVGGSVQDYGMLELDMDDNSMDLGDISLLGEGEAPIPGSGNPYDPYAIDIEPENNDLGAGDDAYDPYALEPNYQELSGRGTKEDDSLSLSGYDLDDEFDLAGGELDDFLPSDFQVTPEDEIPKATAPAQSLDPVFYDDQPPASAPAPQDDDLGVDLGEFDEFGAYGDFDAEPYAAFDEPAQTPDNPAQDSATEAYDDHGEYDEQGYEDDYEYTPDHPPEPRNVAASREEIATVVWNILDEILDERMAGIEETVARHLSHAQNHTRLEAPPSPASNKPQIGPTSRSVPTSRPSRAVAPITERPARALTVLPIDWGRRSPQSRAVAQAKGRRLDFFLDLMRRRGADNLHLHVGDSPMIRVGDAVERLRFRTLRRQDWEQLLKPICPAGKWPTWQLNHDVDFIHESRHGRYHISIFKQREGGSAVLRRIPDSPATLDALGLPDHLARLADLRGGLCIFSGPFGSGTSSTVAALIDLINTRPGQRIITLEEPIDYVFSARKAIIHQREIGVHAASFSEAMQAAVAESPDVLMLGAVTDRESARLAFEAARSGSLVLAMMRARSATEALERIINLFPDRDQNQTRQRLADVVRVVICQQLLPRNTGGKIPAMEILINTVQTGRAIRSGELSRLNEIMTAREDLGMVRMDQSLYNLIKQQVISEESALARTVDPAHLNLLLHGPPPEPEPEPAEETSDVAVSETIDQHGDTAESTVLEAPGDDAQR